MSELLVQHPADQLGMSEFNSRRTDILLHEVDLRRLPMEYSTDGCVVMCIGCVQQCLLLWLIIECDATMTTLSRRCCGRVD